MLKSLFVPKDNYFSDKFTYLKDKFALKVGFGTYLEMFNSLKSVAVGKLDFGGYIDISMWDKYMPTLHNFIRGFFFIMMAIFNVKMIIWMIRGSSFIKDSNNTLTSDVMNRK